MFGLGRKRKTFDFEVTSTLQQVLKIDTDNRTNKRFPGYLVYMDYLDAAWQSKKTVEESVLAIALAYWGGVIESDQSAEAIRDMKEVRSKLESFMRDNASREKIDPVVATHVAGTLDRISRQYNLSS